MDHRGIPFTTLPRRRQRPSTATAGGRKLQKIRQRPGSSMGIRTSPAKRRHRRNDVPHWMDSVVAASPSLYPQPIISKRPWNRKQNKSNSTSSHSNHSKSLSRAMSHSLLLSHPSLSSSSASLSASYMSGNGSSIIRKNTKRRHPTRISEEMSLMSSSVREPRSNSDIVPRNKFRLGGNKPIRPEDVFWIPSRDINTASSYFEGGVFQSLDVWGKVRMTEAEQVQVGVSNAESSYHARIASDTLLRVTRPCLIEHRLSPSIVNRMIKGLLKGAFGRTQKIFNVDTIEGKKAEQLHHRQIHQHDHNNKDEKHTVNDGLTVQLNTISEIMSSPSWIQAAIPLLERQAYEEQFLPQMEGWREAMAKNRQMEINALNRACRSWQNTIRFVIFNRWHEALVGAKAAQERFIKFITKLSGKEHYACFGAWQRMSIITRDNQEIKSTVDLDHQILVAKAALKKTREKIDERKMHLMIMNQKEKELVASCEWTQSELDARYNSPISLNNVTVSLSNSCIPLLPLASTEVVHARSSQVERRDRDHVPIHDMYDYQSTDKESEYFVEAETVANANEEEDDDVDVAFPFELRTGHVVLRWLNYSIRKMNGNIQCIMEDDETNETNETNEDNEDNENNPMNQNNYLKEYNQLKMQHLYAVALRTMPQEMTRAIREERTLNNGNKSNETNENDPYVLGKRILAAGHLRRNGATFGGFLSVEQLVPDHEQDEIDEFQEEEEELQKKRKQSISTSNKSNKSNHSPSSSPKQRKSPKKKKARSVENIQRVMYKGKMIDVEDPSEQLIFGFLCQLMDARPSVDEVEVNGSDSGNSNNNNKDGGDRNMEAMIEAQERKDDWSNLTSDEKVARQKSASKIQAIHRGRRSRNHTLVEYQERTNAALKIQAITRGRNQRREKPKQILSETLIASEVDASMAYDEIHATWLGLTNVLRGVVSTGISESTHEELRIVAEKVAKSRVAKLSSVVFDKWTATEESFLAWRDTMAAAQKLTWRSVCQLTMAQKTLIEERNDDGSYTKISVRRVKDLFPSISAIKTKQDGIQQISDVEDVFKEHLGLTMKLFAHYAGDAGSGSTMNRSEYTRFVKDAKIRGTSRELNGAALDLIFAKVNAPMIGLGNMIKLKGKAKHARENVTQSLSKKNSSSSSSPKLSPSKTAPLIQTELDLNASQDGSMIGNDDNNENENENDENEEEDDFEDDFEGDENDKEIVPQEFIEALLRLSVARYKKGTMAVRVSNVYENLLLPLSSNVNDNTTLRAALSDELVQNVFNKKKRKLKDLFLCYAARDDSDDAVAHSDTINISECIQMCRELSMNIPDRIIARLFACVQGDEDDGDDDTSMLEEQGELTYTEFSELLGALAAWTQPDPYSPLSKKLTVFLNGILNTHEDINAAYLQQSKKRRKSTKK